MQPQFLLVEPTDADTVKLLAEWQPLYTRRVPRASESEHKPSLHHLMLPQACRWCAMRPFVHNRYLQQLACRAMLQSISWMTLAAESIAAITQSAESMYEPGHVSNGLPLSGAGGAAHVSASGHWPDPGG